MGKQIAVQAALVLFVIGPAAHADPRNTAMPAHGTLVAAAPSTSARPTAARHVQPVRPRSVSRAAPVAHAEPTPEEIQRYQY